MVCTWLWYVPLELTVETAAAINGSRGIFMICFLFLMWLYTPQQFHAFTRFPSGRKVPDTLALWYEFRASSSSLMQQYKFDENEQGSAAIFSYTIHSYTHISFSRQIERTYSIRSSKPLQNMRLHVFNVVNGCTVHTAGECFAAAKCE